MNFHTGAARPAAAFALAGAMTFLGACSGAAEPEIPEGFHLEEQGPLRVVLSDELRTPSGMEGGIGQTSYDHGLQDADQWGVDTVTKTVLMVYDHGSLYSEGGTDEDDGREALRYWANMNPLSQDYPSGPPGDSIPGSEAVEITGSPDTVWMQNIPVPTVDEEYYIWTVEDADSGKIGVVLAIGALDEEEKRLIGETLEYVGDDV